jgi:hypothetical protein
MALSTRFFIEGLINLFGFCCIGVLCIARPGLVQRLLSKYSRPGGYFENLPLEGEKFDARLRSTRHLGVFFLCGTLFLTGIHVAAFHFSLTQAPKPSVLSNEPSSAVQH